MLTGPKIPLPAPSELSRRLIRPLTRTELRVTMLIGEGLSYAQLGHALGISRDRVIVHVQAIAVKLSESQLAADELRPIDRVRFWITQLQARTLYERLQTLERELAKAQRHPSDGQGAVCVERRA